MPGTIHEPRSLFLRVACGDAKVEEPHGKIELSHSPGGAPILRSEKTGKWWVLSWKELVTMAIEAGITKE